MAFIKLKDGRGKFVTAEQGATMWRVFNGELKGNKAQRAFCSLIQKIYLNRDNAPDSWKQKYPPVRDDFSPRRRGRQKVMAENIRLPYID